MVGWHSTGMPSCLLIGVYITSLIEVKLLLLIATIVVRQMKEDQLALPGIEQQAITGSNEKVETWQYTNRNSVMYIPDGK